MPVGEWIADFFLRGILEVVVTVVAYYTGACALSVLTLGQLPLAPLATFEERNRKPKGKRDWGIWLYRPGRVKLLKAEWVCVAGFLVWLFIGVGAYVVTKHFPFGEQAAPSEPPALHRE